MVCGAKQDCLSAIGNIVAKSKSSFWKHPVISTVVGGLILSSFTGLGAYFLGFLTVIKQALIDTYTYLISPSTLPTWWVYLISIYFVISIILMLGRKVLRATVSWKDYKKDMFGGLEWRWSYSYFDEISNLHSLCPKCKYQLFPYDYDYDYARNRQQVLYKCEECGYNANIDGDSENDVQQMVRLKIQRKLRTGEWRTNTK
ncbi:hypothetical protein D5E75_03545 [Vibrio parahaemolyticus]|nr:hypothetical protein BBM17_15565 [Vibrio parahaemolyticus]OUJ44489.1 hypothetical protein BTZ05_03320 [Vibrio parahaemolyticus]TBT56014.1 hypothetical protein D5E75_03545 [Vibrio parahaemolyticus]TOF26362.1 hypothetical protein CGJ27_09815 [Vibrio parahaemolyticus]TOK00919.1 hypothetical protein CGI27_05820 [Vibrio parahaemolyticus]